MRVCTRVRAIAPLPDHIYLRLTASHTEPPPIACCVEMRATILPRVELHRGMHTSKAVVPEVLALFRMLRPVEKIDEMVLRLEIETGAYMAMAYIIMAYAVMAYVAMACIAMACMVVGR